jgi:hypothetical protein
MEPWTLECLLKALAIIASLAIAVYFARRAVRGKRAVEAVDNSNASGSKKRIPSTNAQDRSSAAIKHLTMENTILWQGPALALAAEAFLLTIALGKDSTGFVRFLSSLLATVTAGAASFLIYRKGRQVEELKQSARLDEPGGLKAFEVWMFALGVFVLADASIIWLVWCGDPKCWLSACPPAVR